MASAYWCVARTELQREATAAKFLGLAGYATYLPRVCETRVSHGRRLVRTPPLFPAYLFVRIEGGWWSARWCIGVAALIMSSDGPARVPDVVIAELQGRERGGLVELPEAPCLRPGDSVRVTTGFLAGALGVYSGMRGADRVAVLLKLLGTLVLPASSVERA
jgi:transcription antitermination factor NusG